MSKKPYKCVYCGRRFKEPVPHNCKDGFRKHNLRFECTPTKEDVERLTESALSFFEELDNVVSDPEKVAKDIWMNYLKSTNRGLESILPQGVAVASPLDTQVGGGYDKVARFKRICNQLAATYEAKNKDYGDSFGKSVEQYGPIAGVVRISDKFNRIQSLIKSGENPAVAESVEDTLLDMANYCIMLYMEINKKEEN